MASTGDILLLIAREYAVMMILAFAVGIPLSYLFGVDWIGNFAYRMDLNWWICRSRGVSILPDDSGRYRAVAKDCDGKPGEGVEV